MRARSRGGVPSRRPRGHRRDEGAARVHRGAGSRPRAARGSVPRLRGPRTNHRRKGRVADARRERDRRSRRAPPRARRGDGARGASGARRGVRRRAGRAGAPRRLRAGSTPGASCRSPTRGSRSPRATGTTTRTRSPRGLRASRSEVARAGYRRAILAGAKGCAALQEALDLAGVKVRTTSPPAPIGRARWRPPAGGFRLRGSGARVARMRASLRAASGAGVALAAAGITAAACGTGAGVPERGRRRRASSSLATCFKTRPA